MNKNNLILNDGHQNIFHGGFEFQKFYFQFIRFFLAVPCLNFLFFSYWISLDWKKILEERWFLFCILWILILDAFSDFCTIFFWENFNLGTVHKFCKHKFLAQFFKDIIFKFGSPSPQKNLNIWITSLHWFFNILTNPTKKLI